MSALTPEQFKRLDDAGYDYLVNGGDFCNVVAPVVAALIAEAVEQARADVAEQIEAHYLGPDFGRLYDGRESPTAALQNAYDEGLEMAARIARGEVTL